MVLYTTYEGLRAGAAGGGVRLSRNAAVGGGDGERRLGAYGASAGFYYNKAKAENTTGGIVFESACGRQARSGQDCDGWEENG